MLTLLYTCVFYSFLNENGNGLVSYFSRNVLTASIYNGNSLNEQHLHYFFEPKRWYFVCVVHVPKFFGRSELKLYVNGKLEGSVYLSYPDVSKVRV